MKLMRDSRRARGRTLGMGAGAAAIILTAGTQARATDYTFTSIVETPGFETQYGYAPSINDSGQVAFTQQVAIPSPPFDPDVFPPPPPPVQEYRNQLLISTVGSNTYTSIADSTDAAQNFSAFLSEPVINNNGRVAFGTYIDIQTDIRTGTGGAHSVVAVADTNPTTSGFRFNAVQKPSINDAGVVAFGATLSDPDGFGPLQGGGGTFTGNHNGIVQRIAGSSPFADINNANQLALVAHFSSPTPPVESSLIRLESNNSFTRLATQTPQGSYNILGADPGINEHGNVMFFAHTDRNRIYAYNGENLYIVAEANGSFSGSYDGLHSGPAISDNGVTVFMGNTDAGSGIFTGPHSDNDKVIEEFDPLFGQFVASVSFVSGVNAHGQIAFQYSLTNGSDGITAMGIGVATPSTSAKITNTGNVNTSVGGGAGFIGGVNAQFDNVTDTGQFSADYFSIDDDADAADELAVRVGKAAADAASFNFAGDEAQVWTIDFSGDFTGDADLVLHYDDTAMTAEEEALLLIQHFDGVAWFAPGGQLLDTVNNTITLSTAGFSPFALSSAIPEPTSIAVLAVAATALLLPRRRRRRQA